MRGVVWRLAVGLVSLLLLNGCSELAFKQAMENQKPKVSVAGVTLDSLDFERVGLAVKLKVDNPNPVGIDLAGVDYDFILADHSFVKGKTRDGLRIDANQASHVTFPVSLTFDEVYRTLQSLTDRDEVPYRIKTGLTLKVPLIGTYRHPVTVNGSLPLPKRPDIALADFSLDRLSLSGADMILKVAVDNPNDFALDLDKIDYALSVDGQRWVSGSKQGIGHIAKKGKGTIELPVTISFSELGMGVYRALTEKEPLNYSLTGDLNATSSNQLIGQFVLPYQRQGQLALR